MPQSERKARAEQIEQKNENKSSEKTQAGNKEPNKKKKTVESEENRKSVVGKCMRFVCDLVTCVVLNYKLPWTGS